MNEPTECHFTSNRADLEDRAQIDRLMPQVYQELRRMAHRHVVRGPYGNTLNTTSLVHEAYFKLINGPGTGANRSYFFGAASGAMRQVLVDAARRRGRVKRNRGACPEQLEQARLAVDGLSIYLLDLDQALRRLHQHYPRQAKVVEYRFFGGLSIEDIAVFLDSSPRTIKRDWALARAWLYRELKNES